MPTTFIQLVNDVQDATGRMIGSSETQVKRLVLAAYFEVVLAGRLNLVTVDLDLVAGTADYSITADLDIDDLDTIKYLVSAGNGVTTYAQPTGLDEIIDLRSASVINTQTPYLYSLNGDILSLYPTPGTIDTATLWYFARPAALSGNTDPVDETILPPEFHDLIVLRAAAQSARNLNKGKNAQGVQLAMQYQSAYEARLAELKRWRNRREGSRNQMVQVGPPRRPRYANDVYFSGDNR